ncbi:MAG TPA: GNAT family N-acetyltransferase [Holophaga sp.]|nr:GNAT family N-acetyltransferase [Holophaga sp.]
MSALTQIRPCEPGDEPAFIRLNRQFIQEVRSDNPYWDTLALPPAEELGRVFREALACPEGIRIFVAEVDGAVVGYANTWTVYSIWAGGRTLILDDLYVDPPSRSLGIGRRMMAFLADHARAQGCRRMQLHAETTNARAHKLYRELGFQDEEVRFFVRPLQAS